MRLPSFVSVLARSSVFAAVIACVGAVGRSHAQDFTSRASGLLPEPSNTVFEAGLVEFSKESYARAAEELIAAFERRAGVRLAPSARRRAGLKVYSDSGAGLGTPPDLVRGVVSALERRGFERESLLIVGLSEARLRSAGFLPPLSEGGDRFESVPVIALEDGKSYDPQWFYDSPLPARVSSGSIGMDPADTSFVASEDDRKSYLPVPLMFDVDFWINLPSCSDHPVLGVNGALVNATLWNASNTQRFFRSPATGPAAVAEMAAIPELRAGMVFTLISLQRYQFIGGPVFNSLYTVSEPLLWLSDNPALIDAAMRERINRGRHLAGFRVLPRESRLLAYAQQLGLGAVDLSAAEWSRVDGASDETR
ncbi:DUF362 domain-containing protein [Congregicoccus parvus]|uniref:DUF362 domain-containing protein n=1 Tax=Congregicoccus parvus TaxID=3081749 RepID=UPI003FA5D0AE